MQDDIAEMTHLSRSRRHVVGHGALRGASSVEPLPGANGVDLGRPLPAQWEKKCIVDVEAHGRRVQVLRQSTPLYGVWVDGQCRHPRCSAEDVMRVLGTYLHGTIRTVVCP